jgi:hypothetical protein
VQRTALSTSRHEENLICEACSVSSRDDTIGIKNTGSWRGDMSAEAKVRVRLTGRSRHEFPVPVNLGDRLPHIGEIIEVPILGRIVPALVTETTSPICRGETIAYCVFASEVV